MEKQEAEYYKPEELVRKFNVSRKVITKWTQSRKLPGAVKLGGVWRYRVVDIEKALLNGGF